MNTAVKETKYELTGQTKFYRGKVRDVYTIGPLLVMVASDRISAFDVVLPKAIPGKGQVLNQLALYNLEATNDVVPNWLISSPHPRVSIGTATEPFKVEMVIRGYLTGHAWRTYTSGERLICGVTMPDGLKEHDAFPEPIITPTTKAAIGHDEDISREDILSSGLVSEDDYTQLESYTKALFKRGTELAAKNGLILVDTKYEFGKTAEGTIILIDEIHTPDSSRFFYSEGYAERQESGEPQKQLSKEFVREWLIAHDFMGKEGQAVPDMDDDFIATITNRYTELYEQFTGAPFQIDNSTTDEIKDLIEAELARLK